MSNKQTLFILSLYGATGVYDSRPLTARETWDLIETLGNSGAVYSTRKIFV